MAEQEIRGDRICINYKTDGPLELERITEAFEGIAYQYQQILREHKVDLEAGSAKLYVTDLRTGSLTAWIATAGEWFNKAVQVMDTSLIVTEFYERLTTRLSYLAGRIKNRPPSSKADWTADRAFLGVVDKHADGSLHLTHARYEKEKDEISEKHIMEFTLSPPEVQRAISQAESEIENVEREEKNYNRHDAVMLYWYSASRDPGKASGRTPDRAVIEEIWPKPLKTYFEPAAEDLKRKMTAMEQNPFKKLFRVDVFVHIALGKPQAYTIINLRDVQDLDDGDAIT